MKILIIGATRGIGKALLDSALAEDNEVTVLARTPGKISLEHPLLRVMSGDIQDNASLHKAMEGQDGVCSCIGVPITFKPVDIFSRGAANIIEVMKGNPEQKYIAVTGIGAGDSKGHGGFLYDCIFKPLLLRTIYEDKDREEAIIKASSVKWLIVRPGALTNGPKTGMYKVINDLEGVTSKRISRRDVADFMLKQLAVPSQFGRTPLLTY